MTLSTIVVPKFATHNDVTQTRCRRAESRHDCERSHRWHQHDPQCWAYALGCAVENRRDAIRDGFEVFGSVEDEAYGYLRDGCATCHCGRDVPMSATLALGYAVASK